MAGRASTLRATNWARSYGPWRLSGRCGTGALWVPVRAAQRRPWNPAAAPKPIILVGRDGGPCRRWFQVIWVCQLLGRVFPVFLLGFQSTDLGLRRCCSRVLARSLILAGRSLALADGDGRCTVTEDVLREVATRAARSRPGGVRVQYGSRYGRTNRSLLVIGGKMAPPAASGRSGCWPHRFNRTCIESGRRQLSFGARLGLMSLRQPLSTRGNW